jgi:transcriptional regulator with XRE-family HTH domain|nr:helix-turn-helix domain-containing protein [uncultured Emticicia sp.]
MTHIGTKIRQVRTLLGMKQEQIGFVIGKSQQIVNRMENGKRIPTPEELAKIAHEFGMKKEDLENIDRMTFNFTNHEKVEGQGYIVNYTLSEKTETEEVKLLKEQNELLRKQLDILLSKV